MWSFFFNRKKSTPPITLGILTALPKEYAAVNAILMNKKNHYAKHRGAGRIFRIGDIRSSDQRHHRVALHLANIGNNIASIRANNLIREFPDIEAIILFGIAGGIPNINDPETHVRLGDVVISDKKGVVQYDFVKDSNYWIEFRASPIAPSSDERMQDAGDKVSEKTWTTLLNRITY